VELLKQFTETEIDSIVRGYSDEHLADLYSTARLEPGTDWALRLSAEIRRRGLRVKEGSSPMTEITPERMSELRSGDEGPALA
jgi:hypothetical protein